MESTTSFPWQISAGFSSNVGLLRRRNEDAYYVWLPPEEGEDGRTWPGAVFAVADGMGGHEAGDVASRFVVDSIEAAFGPGGELGAPTEEELPPRLARLLDRINSELRTLSEERGAVRGMGSTLTLAVLEDDRLQLAHVGDSRLYRIRDGELTQISEDHSWAAEQRRKGLISAEEEAHHPQKNLLTECIGVDRRVNVFLREETVLDGDRFFLCSDGLHGPVSRDDLASVLTGEADPQEAVARLIDLANAAGGPDNITGIVFDLRSGEGIAHEPTGTGAPVAAEGSPAAGTRISSGARTAEDTHVPGGARPPAEARTGPDASSAAGSPTPAEPRSPAGIPTPAGTSTPAGASAAAGASSAEETRLAPEDRLVGGVPAGSGARVAGHPPPTQADPGAAEKAGPPLTPAGIGWTPQEDPAKDLEPVAGPASRGRLRPGWILGAVVIAAVAVYLLLRIVR